MYLISVEKGKGNVKTPIYVSKDLHTAQTAAKSVALSYLADHAEKNHPHTHLKVVHDKCFDNMPDFDNYLNWIIARYDELNLTIEILKIEEINNGIIFDNFVTRATRLELIRIDEIAEFMVIEPVQMGHVTITANIQMQSLYPSIQKDSKEHVEFMDELQRAIKK